MASLGFNFDATQVEERRGDFQIYPPGRYLVQVLQSDVEDNKNQDGKNAWFEFEIMDGEFQGGTFRHYINNIIHPSDIAQKIGQEELGELCKAVGKFNVQETEEVHFIPMMINLKFVAAGTVTKGKNGKADYIQKNDQNRVSKYELASGSDIIGGTAAQQHPVQQQQRPVQAQQPAQQRPINTQGARPQHPAQQRPATPPQQGRPVPANAPWNTPRQ
jgi:hypothetical protein